MHFGAGGAHDPDIFVLGNVRIIIQLVLDIEAGRRAPENGISHRPEYDGAATPDHDLAQGSASTSPSGGARLVGLSRLRCNNPYGCP